MFQVSTSAYQFAHGKAPRGRGYWAFDFPGSQEPWFAPGDQSFADAKRAAAQEAKRRGVSSASVAT